MGYHFFVCLVVFQAVQNLVVHASEMVICSSWRAMCAANQVCHHYFVSDWVFGQPGEDHLRE